MRVAFVFVAGVVSGGVFTLPVLITALGAFFAKLSASPLNNDAERQADIQARLERIRDRGAL